MDVSGATGNIPCPTAAGFLQITSPGNSRRRNVRAARLWRKLVTAETEMGPLRNTIDTQLYETPSQQNRAAGVLEAEGAKMAESHPSLVAPHCSAAALRNAQNNAGSGERQKAASPRRRRPGSGADTGEPENAFTGGVGAFLVWRRLSEQPARERGDAKRGDAKRSAGTEMLAKKRHKGGFQQRRHRKLF
ncbi:hypothetical protein EYF80_063221 [Liparis tanakae]|uniref:Uncharacterized protein n=1 Tax=Liparis tanakae TaxID=230148 RepID=A0A4Z2ED37_9TELE|nr:hypothetical protein EYF80_063221 [Liparis tanakae]